MNWSESQKYKGRWRKTGMEILKAHVLRCLTGGIGLSFSDGDCKRYNLENNFELKGIEIGNLIISPPKSYTLTFFDFSYGYFFNSVFENIVFDTAYFEFVNFKNFKFKKCTFINFSGFYGCELDGVEFVGCDFKGSKGLENCDLKDVKFEQCYFSKNIYIDCRFDEKTIIAESISKSNNLKDETFQNIYLSEIYKGIKEAFITGGASAKGRLYYYKQMQAVRMYNTGNLMTQFINLVIERLTGYGARPQNVFGWLCFLYFVFTSIFVIKTNFVSGILLSSGAFFTFGINAPELEKLGSGFVLIFILESFFGISMMAIFITTLANYWFNEK